MVFVVKVTGRTGVASCLSREKRRGGRTLATREYADLFETIEAAQTAIAEMPLASEDAGLIFSVEPASELFTG
jgi:hypothetical protein